MGKRRKVEITERVIDGVLTAGKECTKCGEWKPLHSYTPHPKGLGGKSSRCLDCLREYQRERRRNKGIKQRNISEEIHVGDSIIKKCVVCGEFKDITQFYMRTRESGKRRSTCKSCEREKSRKLRPQRLLYEREYREKNRERINEYNRKRYWKLRDYYTEKNKKYYWQNLEKMKDKHYKWYYSNRDYAIELSTKWRKNNPERARLNHLRRKARKILLPDDLSVEQQVEILDVFGGCALTGYNGSDIHWDHVIPLATGHMGTIYENMIPLRPDLNISKSDNNIFEWFLDIKDRFNLDQSRFNALIEYLATINGLTVDEYRQFVYWCHENPRTEDEVAADPRPSIEIWREATGRHFPLPAYAIENDNMSDNERSSS